MRAFGWGAVDQAFSSATNFGLSVAAGRLLGPAGLGGIFVGFAVYLVLLGLTRALANEPIVMRTAPLIQSQRRTFDESGLITCAVGAFGATVVVLIASTLFVAEVEEGLAAFAPWFVPAAVSDYVRSLLFRDRRGMRAAFSSALWFVSTMLTILVLHRTLTIGTLVAVWGLGGTLSAVSSYLGYRFRPKNIRRALVWWSRDIWPSGRWLGLGSLLITTGTYAVALMLAVVIGPGELGGFRAVQSLFAPLSLIGPALTLPGLPDIAAVLAIDRVQAVRRARSLSIKATALVVATVGLFALVGDTLLEEIFGREFVRFAPLIIPVGLAQTAEAGGLGFVLFLKAQQRGRDLLKTGVVGSAGSVSLATGLGAAYGVQGGAWGLALARSYVSVSVIRRAYATPRGDRSC